MHTKHSQAFHCTGVRRRHPAVSPPLFYNSYLFYHLQPIFLRSLHSQSRAIYHTQAETIPLRGTGHKRCGTCRLSPIERRNTPAPSSQQIDTSCQHAAQGITCFISKTLHSKVWWQFMMHVTPHISMREHGLSPEESVVIPLTRA